MQRAGYHRRERVREKRQRRDIAIARVKRSVAPGNFGFEPQALKGRHKCLMELTFEML
jgi:hypothetical protein